MREATPLDDHRVRVKLTDGRVIERDLEPLLHGPVFDEIRSDPALFREMRGEGGTCPDALIWGSLPPAPAA